MFKNLIFPFPFFLDEGDAGGTADVVTTAKEDEVIVVDTSGEDDDDDVLTDEQKKQAIKAFKKRNQKRNYVAELEGKITTLEGKINDLIKLNESSVKKDSTTKIEGGENAEILNKIMSSISDLRTDVEKRIESVTSELAKDRISNDRREMLVEAGVKPKFISALLDGTINVPQRCWEDEGALYGFIDKFDGFSKSSGKKSDGTDSGKKTDTKKSVAHTDLSDVGGTVQSDKKGQGGLSETLKAIETEVDNVFKEGVEKEGGILSTASLTKLMKLAETADSAKKG